MRNLKAPYATSLFMAPATIPAGFRALPLPLVQLSLAAVLKCGQSFRWTAHPLPDAKPDDIHSSHEYRFCLHDRVICLRQTSDTLLYRSVFPIGVTSGPTHDAETLAWLRDYFQLDVDLPKLYDEWSKRDPVFAKLRSRFVGIRMLRQDPWENLVSFICSSNNNISRITKMVQALCKQYSPPLLSLELPSGDPKASEAYHPFPPPSVLAKPEVSSILRSLGFGYRADFIQRTAAMLVETHGSSSPSDSSREPAEEWLKTLRDVSANEARDELLKFIGVGRKVADCVLLMSLDHKDVVPVDTHVHQIAIKHYGLRGSTSGKQAMNPRLYEEVNTRLANVWGDYAGWAHSVLFTADLKSFSLYGLPATSSSPTKVVIKTTEIAEASETITPTQSTHSRRKRRVSEVKIKAADSEETDTSPSIESYDFANLAERVKRRRRLPLKKT